MRMQEDDPHRCQNHPLVSAPQVTKTSLVAAPQVMQAAIGSTERKNSKKQANLVMMLCSHCNKMMAPNGCSYPSLQDDGSTRVCGRSVCRV